MTAAAAEGRFELQQCDDCGAVQYPPREACHRCLSVQLKWREQSGEGELLSQTTLAHSNDLFFRERLPWRLGLVRLDAGVTLMLHLHGDVPDAPARVKVGARLDRAGQAVLIAFPSEETPNMADDPMLREMGCDPKFRKVLVTDGKTAVGQASCRRWSRPAPSWSGSATPNRGRSCPGWTASQPLPQVSAGAAGPEQRTLGVGTRGYDRRQGGHRRSTTPRCTARRAWPAGAAPTWRVPRWTSTTSGCCAWRRSSAPR